MVASASSRTDVCRRLNTLPHLPTRPRTLVLLAVLALAAAALPGRAAGQSVEDPVPPPPPPASEPPVEVEVPPGPLTITLTVPPLPEKKAAPKVAPTPKPAPEPAAKPAPRTWAPSPARVEAPVPAPEYSPTPAAEPEPAAVTRPKRAAAKRAKARRPKRAAAVAALPAEEPIEPALPVVTIVEERRSFAAALPRPPYAPEEAGSPPPYLLFLLGLAGASLLGLAGAAPRLALLWPEVFVPVIRERDVVSFFGLCLLASGVLAWAIAGTGF